jgi:hypothetical protein
MAELFIGAQIGQARCATIALQGLTFDASV